MIQVRFYVYFALILLLCVGLKLDAQSGSQTARFPESRSYSPGHMWLKWSPSERTGFVRGFIVGRDDGFREACMISADANNAAISVNGGFGSCLERLHLFKKDLSYYVQFITDFYNQHSEDRDVPLRILLPQADQRTPEVVHQWLGKQNR
jgi:hypothetical protein